MMSFLRPSPKYSIINFVPASMFLYCFGTLLSYVIGTFLTYHIIIWINVILSVTGTVLIALVTESPMFYLRQNREEVSMLPLIEYLNHELKTLVLFILFVVFLWIIFERWQTSRRIA